MINFESSYLTITIAATDMLWFVEQYINEAILASVNATSFDPELYIKLYITYLVGSETMFEKINSKMCLSIDKIPLFDHGNLKWMREHLQQINREIVVLCTIRDNICNYGNMICNFDLDKYQISKTDIWKYIAKGTPARDLIHKLLLEIVCEIHASMENSMVDESDEEEA